MPEIRCFEDMDQFGAECDDSLEELTQDLYHRTIEEPGSNIDDPARGFGLRGRLSGSGRAGAVSPAIKHGLEAEMRKDDRVVDARATVIETSKGVYEVELKIEANEGVLGIKLVADGAGVRRVL